MNYCPTLNCYYMVRKLFGIPYCSRKSHPRIKTAFGSVSKAKATLNSRNFLAISNNSAPNSCVNGFLFLYHFHELFLMLLPGRKSATLVFFQTSIVPIQVVVCRYFNSRDSEHFFIRPSFCLQNNAGAKRHTCSVICNSFCTF